MKGIQKVTINMLSLLKRPNDLKRKHQPMLPIQLNYILIQKSAFNFGSHPNPNLYDSSKIFRGWLSHSVLDIPNVKTKVTTEPQEE